MCAKGEIKEILSARIGEEDPAEAALQRRKKVGREKMSSPGHRQDGAGSNPGLQGNEEDSGDLIPDPPQGDAREEMK